jgi:hypothetical protein
LVSRSPHDSTQREQNSRWRPYNGKLFRGLAPKKWPFRRS